MAFWIAAALLTLAATLSVLLPLARSEQEGGGDDGGLAVYRDQLGELDRDAERGLIAPSAIEAARAEIGRRILKAAAAARSGQGLRIGRAARMVGTVGILAVPLVGWGVYAIVGSPDLPSQPLEARLAAAQAGNGIQALVARAEAHLAGNPDDGRGWDVLAPIYVRLGRNADAIAAYQRAIRLVGDSADREAGLGEALAALNGGTVSPQADAAFAKALRIEPGHPKAKFFRAVSQAQQGSLEQAVRTWRQMTNDLPEDSPWRLASQEALAAAASRTDAGTGAQVPLPPGTDAANLTAAERSEMIETMVASLDDRLRKSPQDPEGWMRLVRSYLVLGRQDRARDALARGLDALGKDTPDAEKLTAFATGLGLEARE